MRSRTLTGGWLYWSAAIAVLFAVATPKVLIGSTPVYAGEILLLVTAVMLVLLLPRIGHEILISRAVACILIFYTFVLIGSAVTATLEAGFDLPSFLLLGKRILYHLVLLLFAANGIRLLNHSSDAHVHRFFRMLLALGLVPLFFSIAELLAFARFGLTIPMEYLVDYDQSSFSPTLFAMGFTGRALNSNGMYVVGSASINYGILNAGLATLAFLYFRCTRQHRWLVCGVLYAAGVVLTMSSTALVVLVAAAMTHFLLAGNHVFRMGLLIFAMSALFAFLATIPPEQISFFGLGDIVRTLQGVLYGTSDASNITLRIETFLRALGGIEDHPRVMLLGAGIDHYAASVMNYSDPLIESFVIDAFFTAGMIGFVALALSFAFLASSVRQITPSTGATGVAADFVIRYTPGLLFANALSGNSVQSEFVGGLLFLALGICAGAAAISRGGLPVTIDRQESPSPSGI